MSKRIVWCIMGLQNHQYMRPTRVTLFALAYEIKVVIPIEIGLPMVRTTVQESKTNEGNLEVHLDWADEDHEVAAIRLAPYQQRTIA